MKKRIKDLTIHDEIIQKACVAAFIFLSNEEVRMAEFAQKIPREEDSITQVAFDDAMRTKAEIAEILNYLEMMQSFELASEAADTLFGKEAKKPVKN